MTIDTDVLQELSVAELTADGVRLSRQVDRKLYTRIAKVLEAGGAKWDRKRGMHVFDSSAVTAAGRIEQAILTGEITTRQDIDFFETPDPIIDMMLERADLRPEHDVLEPSAGRGAIAARIQSVGAARQVCVEYDQTNIDILRSNMSLPPQGPSTHCADFTSLAPAEIGLFDRVIMNPPFSSRKDIVHIRHAYDFLKPGGRLVSIASAGVQFRQDRKTMDFLRWLGEHVAGIEDLPDGSFKSSGIMVRTVMITIDNQDDMRREP